MVQSGLNGVDNDRFSSQFWEFSLSSIVRIQLEQIGRMERPPPSIEGEGMGGVQTCMTPPAPPFARCNMPRRSQEKHGEASNEIAKKIRE